jgi:hypothetical protein
MTSSAVISPKRRRLSSGSSRDSFARFADDLAADLLTHLSLDDRFRYECLCRQWQRVVYRTQTRLTIDDSYLTTDGRIDVPRVETIVRKCAHVSRVDYYCTSGDHFTDQLMDALITYCVDLTSVHMRLNDGASVETIDAFFAKFGKRLHRLRYESAPDQPFLTDTVFKNMRFCANLQELAIDGPVGDPFAPLLADQTHATFDKLRKLAFEYRFPSAGSRDTFAAFVDQYGPQLTAIDAKLPDTCDKQSIDHLMTGLARIHGLTDLQITYNTINDEVSAAIIAGLRLLALHCPRLKRLSLHLNYEFARILDAVNACMARVVRRVELRGFVYDRDDAPLRSGALRDCRRVTHLTIDYFSQMGEEFFEGLSDNMPALRTVWLSEVDVSDLTVRELVRLPALESVDFDGRQRASRKSVQSLVEQLPKIRHFLINDRHYV